MTGDIKQPTSLSLIHICWACFQLLGVSYDYLSKDKKVWLLKQITRFVANLGEEAQILIIPVAQDVKKHMDRLISEFDPQDPLYDVAKAHAKGTRLYLEDKIRSNGASNDLSLIHIFFRYNQDSESLKLQHSGQKT